MVQMEVGELSNDARIILALTSVAVLSLSTAVAILWNHLRRRERKHDDHTEKFTSVAADMVNEIREHRLELKDIHESILNGITHRRRGG